MLSILDLGPRVLAYHVEGKVEREDVDRVFAEMDRKLASDEKLRVYAEVESMTGVSLDALWQDVRLGIQRWSALSRIDRAALVTDLGWLRRATIWEDRLLRGIHLRTFPLAERDEARAWVRS